MALFRTNDSSESDQWVFGPMGRRTNGISDQLDFGPMPIGRRTNGPSDQWDFGPIGFRTNANRSSDQWAVGPSTWHHYVYNACRSLKGMSKTDEMLCLYYRKQAKYLYYRPPYMHCAHFTPCLHSVYTVFTQCLHSVYTVHTLPVRVLREAVKMSSAFPRPTISAANGCAIIAALPLKRLHHRMRPVDADLVYTSTGQVALTILLENGDPMLIVGLTRLLLHWLCYE